MVGGINSGFEEHGSLDLTTNTKNWRATLLRGDVELGEKSSIISAAARNPVPLFALYFMWHNSGFNSAPGN